MRALRGRASTAAPAAAARERASVGMNAIIAQLRRGEVPSERCIKGVCNKVRSPPARIVTWNPLVRPACNPRIPAPFSCCSAGYGNMYGRTQPAPAACTCDGMYVCIGRPRHSSSSSSQHMGAAGVRRFAWQVLRPAGAAAARRRGTHHQLCVLGTSVLSC